MLKKCLKECGISHDEKSIENGFSTLYYQKLNQNMYIYYLLQVFNNMLSKKESNQPFWQYIYSFSIVIRTYIQERLGFSLSYLKECQDSEFDLDFQMMVLTCVAFYAEKPKLKILYHSRFNDHIAKEEGNVKKYRREVEIKKDAKTQNRWLNLAPPLAVLGKTPKF